MPLRIQIAVAFSALLAMVLLFSFVLVHHSARQGLLLNLDRDLIGLARTELSSAIDDPNRGPHLHGKDADHQGILFLPDGMVLTSTPSLQPAEVRELIAFAQQLGPSQGETFHSLDGYRILLMPAHLDTLPQAQFLLRVPLQPIERSLSSLRWSLGSAGLAATLVGSLLTVPLSLRLTRPLERVVQVSAEVARGAVQERLPLTQESREVQQLQSSLNQMLDSLQARENQQKQFVADASHELRNPLHALQGTLEVARRRPRTPDEYQEVLDTALQETRRLIDLADDLLELSRADLRRLELRRKPLQLLELARDSLRFHQALADQAQVQLFGPVGPSGTLQADPDRLRQVLDNLLDNAIRHCPRGGMVEVGVEETPQALVLAVSNSGQSLPAEDYEKMFGRFTRLDHSRQRRSGGMGLGLAICRALVEAHGGHIRGRARAEGGSRFEVVFPKNEQNVNKPQKA